MKVIDLLNLVYEKKAPRKILYKYCEYEFYKRNNDYQNIDGLNLFEYLFRYERNPLSLEIEIIEENKDIEEIDMIENIGNHYIIKDGKQYQLSRHDTVIINKINELVRELNKLKNK